MITPELEAKALLGRAIKNAYGRPLGRIVGLERNAFGEFEGVQVESEGGQLFTVKVRQLALTANSVTMTPEWMIETEDVISELSLLRKRVAALKSMKDSGEVEGEIYAELVDSQRSGYLAKVKEAEDLADSVKNRLEEITGQISSLSRYLANAKLDYKSGELDEASLRLAESSMRPALQSLMAERSDLHKFLRILEEARPARVKLD